MKETLDIPTDTENVELLSDVEVTSFAASWLISNTLSEKTSNHYLIKMLKAAKHDFGEDFAIKIAKLIVASSPGLRFRMDLNLKQIGLQDKQNSGE